AVLLFLVAISAIRDHRRRGGLPYPAGPPPLPTIGNLLDIPLEFSWLAYTRFSKHMGNVLSFRVLLQVIVVLNTAEAAKDLLENRRDIYPDRPPVPDLRNMRAWSFRAGFLQSTSFRDGMGVGFALCKKRRPLASWTTQAG
ncbi:hypothetical protein BJV74DRAFT_775392, partial [Russula compacta]